MVYYLYNDEDKQLIGIDKTTCSALSMNFFEGQINDITFLVAPTGDVYPEKDLPKNERTLKGLHGGEMNTLQVLAIFLMKMILRIKLNFKLKILRNKS